MHARTEPILEKQITAATLRAVARSETPAVFNSPSRRPEVFVIRVQSRSLPESDVPPIPPELRECALHSDFPLFCVAFRGQNSLITAGGSMGTVTAQNTSMIY
jgi:hypothetical protein